MMRMLTSLPQENRIAGVPSLPTQRPNSLKPNDKHPFNEQAHKSHQP